ncbi:hypothetical protein B0H14DRAFT_3532032 [Mycena olivaceomarginata]|nr:hypothetical protein B0H14DRAFT_3532032 [Mycena olivaceomarginata]
MADFLCRQAEKKLSHFWAPVYGAWFSKYPEQAELDLPLPDKPDARQLTPEENKKLGDAITERKKQIASWFRYQKTKIGSANPGTNSAQSIKLDVLVHALLQQKSHKPRRARQPIEVFQRRNRALIRETLVAEGYDNIGGRDVVDDWTNESDGTEPALAKSVKAARMCLRTHVVNALWTEATDEERAQVQAEVEAEKEELREAEMREEEEAAERTPAQIQDGIDGLDAFYTKVHTAGHLATKWVGMTLVGGPNPQLGGELSMKMYGISLYGLASITDHLLFPSSICHGEMVEGNDFEDSALEPRAVADNDSSRPATVIHPVAPQAPAPPPAPSKKKTRKCGQKKGVPAVQAPPPPAPTASALPATSPSAELMLPSLSPLLEAQADVNLDDFNGFDESQDFCQSLPGDIIPAQVSGGASINGSMRQRLTLGGRLCGGLPMTEWGEVPTGPTMAIDPVLLSMGDEPFTPTPPEWARPSLLFEAFKRPPPAPALPMPSARIGLRSLAEGFNTPTPPPLPVVSAPPTPPIVPVVPAPLVVSAPPVPPVVPRRHRAGRRLCAAHAARRPRRHHAARRPPRHRAARRHRRPSSPRAVVSAPPVVPVVTTLVIPASRPAAKPVQDVQVAALGTEPVKRGRGRPRKVVPPADAAPTLPDVTNTVSSAPGAASKQNIVVVCTEIGDNRGRRGGQQLGMRAAEQKAAAEALAAQRAKGWVQGSDGSVTFLRARWPPRNADGSFAGAAPKVVVPQLDASEKALLERAAKKRKAEADAEAAPSKRRRTGSRKAGVPLLNQRAVKPERRCSTSAAVKSLLNGVLLSGVAWRVREPQAGDAPRPGTFLLRMGLLGQFLINSVILHVPVSHWSPCTTPCLLCPHSRQSLSLGNESVWRKRKKPTTYHFGLPPAPNPTPPIAESSSTPDPTAPAPAFSAGPRPPTTRVLREKTRIRQQDGRVSQARRVVDVAIPPRDQPNRTHPDLPKDQPIYDWYGGGDVDMDRADEDEGEKESGRALRSSDHPLRQWAEDHLVTYLEEALHLEGRGDHHYLTCRLCGAGKPDHRCRHCLNGGELICHGCVVAAHAKLPFHIIEYWTGEMFVRKSLKDLGLLDLYGVHEVGLDYCGCGRGGHTTVQLLRAQLWPATTTNPKTAATFAVLRHYQLLSFESKCSALEFYQSLARQTDNLGLKKRKKSQKDRATGTLQPDQKLEKDRYHEFLRMTREWRHVRMLKQAGRGHDPTGVANTKPGECALLCPACPQPGKNLPANWQEAPESEQFLHGLYLAIDANFRLKRKDVSTEERDPGLGNGLAFFGDVKAYMEHVRRNWDQKQDRSHCVAHDAVDKPDRESRGTASSGIGAMDCARHNMKRPLAVGDLQLGERYLNMDYMFFRSIVHLPLIRFFVSYDIACQWHINIWRRLVEYQDPSITIDGKNKFFTFLVPKFHLPAHIEACNLKFSFHLTPDVGQTDGEAPERGWANTNPLARSTKEMGLGSRCDTLDDHFNDWNHKKIIAMGHTLRRKMEVAVPEMVKTREALADLEESLGTKVVEEWTAMALEWEADIAQPNPFETQRRDTHAAEVRAELAAEAAARERVEIENVDTMRCVSVPNPFETYRKNIHVAKVRAELAAEAAARERAGTEEAGAVRGDMHITELVGMGLQLEDQQRVLAFDVASTGLHPTDRQRRAMVERTSKLRRKIVTWIDIQSRFFPGLKNVRELEDEARAQISATDALWLPSAITIAREDEDVVPAVWDGVREVSVAKTTFEHEYRLRVGQAEEALHEVRRLLLVRTHVYKLKDTHSRGVRANMRSQDKIAALNGQVRRAADQYRTACLALVGLGGVLRRDEWKKTLLELKSDDVRGLPQATFHDPERKKKTKGKRRKKQRVERETSWIWVTQGARYNLGDGAAMHEAVRIEWAKEVDLLEAKMARVRTYLAWRAEWWKGQVGRRPALAEAQLEGETVFALRQAAIQTQLAAGFADDWKSLPDLVVKGRGGELEDGAVELTAAENQDDSDEEESDKEEAAIGTLPQREIKTTYVDEVLEM